MSWGETIFLKKVIQGEKRFVVSDATLASVLTNKFYSKLNGMVRIKFEGQAVGGDVTYSINWTDDNGSVFSSPTYTQIGSYGTTTNFEKSYDFPVYKGKTYTATVIKSGGSGTMPKLTLNVCGQVTDANYFELR